MPSQRPWPQAPRRQGGKAKCQVFRFRVESSHRSCSSARSSRAKPLSILLVRGPFSALGPPLLLLQLESPSFSFSFSSRVSVLLRIPPISFVSESSILSLPLISHPFSSLPPRDPVTHPFHPRTGLSPETNQPVFNAIATVYPLHLESLPLLVSDTSPSRPIPAFLLPPPFWTRVWRIRPGFSTPVSPSCIVEKPSRTVTSVDRRVPAVDFDIQYLHLCRRRRFPLAVIPCPNASGIDKEGPAASQPEQAVVDMLIVW